MISRNSAAILLLAFMGMLSFGAARRESPSFDEVAHIGAGLSYVQKFDLRLNPEHPPLSKMLTGLTLTLRGVRADYGGTAWKVSDDFVSAFLGQWSFGHWVIARWNDPGVVLLWARLPMLVFMLGLGWAIFRIGTRFGGVAGGLVCLAAYVSAPVFLAFGPLVLTDIPIAFFSVVTVWTFAEMWDRPERAQVWRFALCLAGAFLVKFSAPILLLGLICAGLSTGRRRHRFKKPQWRAFGKGVLIAALVVYAVYFVMSWNQPTTSLARLGSSLPAMVLRRLLMPAAIYLGGAVLVLFTFGRATFLLGQAYPHGVWFFYPVVFALKSQLGFLGLLVLAVVLGVRRKASTIPAELQMHWRTLWVTLVVFVAVCMLSRFDISIRHFSVPLALLMLMLAPLPRLAGSSNALRVLIAVLAVSCLITAVLAYPWYFPYVNALGAGRPAYALMSDSNVDWNQALPEVSRFAERHGLKDVAMDNYGISDDLPYVPQSHPWNCQSPGPADAGRWVVVSANMILDAHNCGWLLRYPQEALAGGGMYAFHLPAVIPPAGAAGGPPAESARRMFLGMPFDFKAVTLQVLRNPETIPAVIKEMTTNFGGPQK